MEKTLTSKPVVKLIFDQLEKRIKELESSPHLTILQVGNNPASEFYISNLIKKGKAIGIEVSLEKYDENTPQNSVIKRIEALNEDTAVHGIMLQKPFPQNYNDSEFVDVINWKKDVDGFHPQNLGNLMLGRDGFIPCTPMAVLEMMDYYQIFPAGKDIVIAGRSDIVGKPLANMLISKGKMGDATVTVVHSKTKNLEKKLSEADIIVAAIGQPLFIKPHMISEGVIIFDVGVNRILTNDGREKYVGDVDYDACFEKVAAITPVPGGVGSVTTALLLKNLVKAYEYKSG